MGAEFAEEISAAGASQTDALRLGPAGSICCCNLDLHGDGPKCADTLQYYYRACTGATGLHVTTSCFTKWRQHKKTNAYGKVIPTTRASTSSHPFRVFFFDDNLELD